MSAYSELRMWHRCCLPASGGLRCRRRVSACAVLLAVGGWARWGRDLLFLQTATARSPCTHIQRDQLRAGLTFFFRGEAGALQLVYIHIKLVDIHSNIHLNPMFCPKNLRLSISQLPCLFFSTHRSRSSIGLPISPNFFVLTNV